MCFTERNLKVDVLSFKVSDNVVFTTSSSSLSPMSYPCRGRHGVLERLLVQPGHSVRNLCLTQVQQRGPFSSHSLGRVDLERPLGRSDSLPEDFILCCRNLLAVTLSILVLRKCSLGIQVQRCIEVEWKLISCCGLHWRGSGEWGAWPGIPWLAVVPRSSHGHSRRSHGVLACLLASLARLTRELIELCGVWRNLSGDLVLVGDPAGVADLVLSESRSGTGKDAWTVGLMELSGTLGSSMRRWSNVHINIKSTSVAWLMVLGMEGKRSGVLVPVWMETSGPPTGVAAGFSCPADPSTPAAGRGAGPSKSCGSSKRNCELCDDSTIETSAVLSVSATVVGPSTVTGPSPVAKPSPVAEPSPVAGPLPVAELSPVSGRLPVADPRSVAGSLPVTVPLRTAGPSLVVEPLPAAGLHLLSRLLPASHLLSCPLPGPGLELLGPIQNESVEPAMQPLW